MNPYEYLISRLPESLSVEDFQILGRLLGRDLLVPEHWVGPKVLYDTREVRVLLLGLLLSSFRRLLEAVPTPPGAPLVPPGLHRPPSRESALLLAALALEEGLTLPATRLAGLYAGSQGQAPLVVVPTLVLLLDGRTVALSEHPTAYNLNVALPVPALEQLERAWTVSSIDLTQSYLRLFPLEAQGRHAE